MRIGDFMNTKNNENLEIITNNFTNNEIENTVNVLNEYLGNSANHSNELKKILDNLSRQESKMKEFNNKEWWDVTKVFYKGAKWEEQAPYIYEGMKANFLLNRDNSKIILQIMKILIGNEYKINKNLEKINKVVETAIKGDESKLKALKNIKEDIRVEKEKTKEEFKKIQDNMDESIHFSNDIIDILSQMTGNYGERMSTIDEKIIELEEKNIKLSQKISKIKKGKFFNTITTLNLLILIFILVKMFFIK